MKFQNIDLHALTGWIPERKAIREKDPDFNRDSLFETLESRMSKGDVLVTVATGELSDNDAERSGLVPTHAYAVMEVLTVKGVSLKCLRFSTGEETKYDFIKMCVNRFLI